MQNEVSTLDKYEYKIRSEEIKTLVAEGEYAEAVKIADTIDWRRVRSVMMLCMISDLYKINRRYQESKEILLLAYEKHPTGRLIVYSLCELSIKLGEYVQAMAYYNEFSQIAPKDTGRYILLYRLYEAQDVSLEERIAVLEELKKRDYREKWAYELAYLYHRIGLATKCVEECDEMFLWFGEGRYVLKALELKMLHEPLSADQQEKYDSWMNESEEELSEETEEESEAYEPEAEEPVPEVTQTAGDIPRREMAAQQENSVERENIEEMPTTELPEIRAVDVGQYNTINLQAELAGHVKEVLGSSMEEELPEEFAAEAAAEDLTKVLPEIKGADRERPGAQKAQHQAASNVRAFEQEEEQSPAAAVNVPVFEQEEEQHPAAAVNVPAFEQEKAAQGSWSQTGASEVHEAKPQTEIPEIREPKPQTEIPEIREPKPQTTAPEMKAAQRQAASNVRTFEQEAAQRQTASNVRAFEQEKVRSLERREEPLTPKNVRPSRFDNILSQEYDGQIRLVVPDAERVEKQITGQLSIEDIMAEWEQMKKTNEQKRMEDVRKHILAQTGSLFANFDEATKNGLLEELERAFVAAIKKEAEKPGIKKVILPEDVKEAPVQEQPAENMPKELKLSEEPKLPKESELSEEPELSEESELSEETQISEESAKLTQAQNPAEEERLSGQEAAAEEAAADAVQETNRREARDLTEEELELFGRFVHHRRSRQQLVNTLDNMSLASYTGNVLLTGEEEDSILALAKGLIREMQYNDSNFSGKVAKIAGSSLNRKDVEETLARLDNGALIIEKAAGLNRDTASKLGKALEKDNKGLFLLLTDSKSKLDSFLGKNAALKNNFNLRIDVEALDDESLVEYAKLYAQEQEYSIDDFGVLALHTRIDENQTSDHEVTLADVRELVDEAIYYANKKTPKHFVDILFGKRYDQEDMIVLREKDFMH